MLGEKESENMAELVFCFLILAFVFFGVTLLLLASFSLQLLAAVALICLFHELRYWDLSNKLNRMQKQKAKRK